MELEQKIYLEELYDLYMPLLTEYQKEIFSLYYIEDLSLFEIAELKKVSRNAVFSLLHRVEKILEDYESKLNLYKKYNDIKKTLENNNIDKKVVSKIESIIER